MFFLGLLSTPLPYLLLAAFYFFGFAMGMFNNSTGDEPQEAIAAVTIPAESVQKTAEQSTCYYQFYVDQVHFQVDICKSVLNTTPYIPDTGTIAFHPMSHQVHEFLFSGFQFSRPPPAGC